MSGCRIAPADSGFFRWVSRPTVLFVTLLGIMLPAVFAQSASVPVDLATQPADASRYISDGANLIQEPFQSQIVGACREIETQMRIRVLVKTEMLPDLKSYPQRVEDFFTDWIRAIDMDKRGILLYAALPENSLQGKFNLRVGIGLKYLITREMGDKILNQIILPNNLEKRDGKGFLEGVATIKRMLLDELRREDHRRTVQGTTTFSLRSFLWASKEIVLALLIGLFLAYAVFFIERCPRCNGSLHVSLETLKEAGVNTLGLRRRVFSCERCGFSRRKKEPIYPSGRTGWWMWLVGTRRNIRINRPAAIPSDLSADDRHSPPS